LCISKEAVKEGCEVIREAIKEAVGKETQKSKCKM